MIVRPFLDKSPLNHSIPPDRELLLNLLKRPPSIYTNRIVMNVGLAPIRVVVLVNVKTIG